eukprot:4222287-Prymnesium_polylepis.3
MARLGTAAQTWVWLGVPSAHLRRHLLRAAPPRVAHDVDVGRVEREPERALERPRCRRARLVPAAIFLLCAYRARASLWRRRRRPRATAGG